jgi:quercetin dioxygenase-like cupin family protein
MYGIASGEGFAGILAGIQIKTLCRGERMLMSEFRLEKGASLPMHSHPNEQTGYLVRGRLVMHIGPSARELGPGDSWSIGSEVPHRAEALEDSVAIEVFDPVRDDYLKYLRDSDTAT